MSDYLWLGTYAPPQVAEIKEGLGEWGNEQIHQLPQTQDFSLLLFQIIFHSTLHSRLESEFSYKLSRRPLRLKIVPVSHPVH
jgi:hypothetical protein